MKRKGIIGIVILAILVLNTAAFARSNSGNVAGNAGLQNSSAGSGFTDISSHWAKDSIDRVADKTIFNISDGKFQPDKPITRSEFVMLLHKALGIQIMYFKATDIGEFFNDVKNEDAYASALYDLVIANIIDYKGSFKPDSSLTREEMVHFLMNAYKYEMGDKFKQIKLSSNPFTDNGKINPIYGGEATRAEHDGLIKRPANGRFYPKDLTTRAQAVTVADRLAKLLDRERSQISVVPSAEIKDGSLHMKLTITNNSIGKVVMNHTSGQKYDFVLLDANRKILYTWSADKMFVAALSTIGIDPGKSVEFSTDAGKDIYDGIQGKAVYMKAYITGSSDNFSINKDGYEAVIRQ